ncbi:MAG: hypothetical protein M2R45_02209 [Verrucomicrobia subdivision 3 bacterium]|nr:hypothetical protein [Limisphaerales bacterium]MCS1414005.1 hypothetical protein [Limisphaerales bacterium]
MSTSPLLAKEQEFLAKKEAEQLFVHQIWPQISAKCLPCHGDNKDKIKANLNLTQRSTALEGGDSGPALIPGDTENSLIFQAITWTDEDLQMPPKENDRLSITEIKRFKLWIQSGAPWPAPEKIQELAQTTPDPWLAADGVQVPTSGGLSEAWTRRPYQPENLWAYQPLTKPSPPAKSQHPIDAFLEQQLKALNLPAAPRADRLTLIRRATYDLLGLPPTPEETETFLNDPHSDDQAFRTVVEKLLSSPHYGEQWGRHWLDVVRYADTSGLANDFARGNAWRYRDYVIRSFNDDKPYPQFIREQIAGDELNPDSPENLVAAGFLRMGPWELTGMEVPAIARQQFLDDVVNAVGQTFLGHSLRCAKCHDHKFDPVPTRDYYSLYSVFNSTQLSEREAAFLHAENTHGFKERRYLEKQRKKVQEQLTKLNQKTNDAIANWFRERKLPYKTRAEAQKAGLGPDEIPPRRYGFSVEDFGRERMARKTLVRADWELERYEPIAFSVYSGVTPVRNRYTSPQRPPADPLAGGEMETGYILTGGDAFSKAAPVKPAALSVLNEAIPELAHISFPEGSVGRRAALSRWITHPQNPLTSRTIVNRIWQWHFGIPLAGNPNNLGATGKKPTHPQLLDWLAVTFLESGGSFKAMHRLIMSSRAYQRSSHHPAMKELDLKDPKRTSYAAFLPRRLTAEELRDSMLAVSGELNCQIGGIPNRPEINLEVALQPRMVMGTFATAWQPNPLPRQRHRRSVYSLKVRGLRDPFMEVFNEPDPDLSCEARDASSVTPQVFSLFNSQISYDRAVAFALRLEAETSNAETALYRAFALAFGRPPSIEELAACREHLATMHQRHARTEIPKLTYPTSVTREAVEENTGEKFQFTETLDVFEDFIPDKKLADVPVVTRSLAELCLVLFNANEFAYVY